MNPLIKINNVSKSFGKFDAVKSIDLQINEGEFFGLIGPNGAGKTTLFKMLLGILPPSKGSIEFRGKDINKTWSRSLREDIGYLPENVSFYDYLTGEETLKYFARLKGASHQDVKKTIETVGIESYVHRHVKEYSKGMRQRLGLAQAILTRPKVLFLDEPTSGLDPEGVSELFKILYNLKVQGVTLIMTSHILKEIQERVDRLGVMLNGNLHAVGTLPELRKGLDLSHGVVLYSKDNDKSLLYNFSKFDVKIQEKTDKQFVLKFPEAIKIDVINEVMKHRDRLDDIEIFSPGLDDVFHGVIDGDLKNS